MKYSIIIYNLLISTIFIMVSVSFLFPSNFLIPLDRRIIGLLGAVLCIIVDQFISDINKSSEIPGKYVDFSVLVMLLSIMSINFIMSRQSIVHRYIQRMKDIIRESNRTGDWRGFWLVSLTSFVLSPFIMNDGMSILS